MSLEGVNELVCAWETRIEFLNPWCKPQTTWAFATCPEPKVGSQQTVEASSVLNRSLKPPRYAKSHASPPT